MNLLHTILYSFILGLTEILPVSSQAHRMLMNTLAGGTEEPVLLRLLIHIGILAALYVNCQNHILRISRAQRLSRVSKRKRTRPLDMNSLMDLRILQTMLIPVIIAFLNYRKLYSLVTVLSVLSGVLFLNGVLLYMPQFLPGSNKSSLSISPFDSVLMGLGAALSLIPGVSCIGIVTAIAIVRGAEKSYALSIALLLNLGMTVGLIAMDILSIVQNGIGTLSFVNVLTYILGAAVAFGGALAGIYVMKKLAATKGFGIFAYYCWGAALFLFILFLSV